MNSNIVNFSVNFSVTMKTLVVPFSDAWRKEKGDTKAKKGVSGNRGLKNIYFLKKFIQCHFTLPRTVHRDQCELDMKSVVCSWHIIGVECQLDGMLLF